MRPPMSVSASSQLTSTNSPEPRFPFRFRGLRIRSGSWIWLIVAGPFAHVRPREPVHRVALELRDALGLLVHVRHEPTGRLTVEADRRDERVMFLDALGPGCGIELDPVVPPLRRRRDGEFPGRGALLRAGVEAHSAPNPTQPGGLCPCTASARPTRGGEPLPDSPTQALLCSSRCFFSSPPPRPESSRCSTRIAKRLSFY